MTDPSSGTKTSEEISFFHPATLVATWFGLGRLPVAPGTWASLAALPIAAGIVWIGGPWLLSAAIVAAALAGAWAAGRYAEAMHARDPRAVVVDEVAGQWLALLPLSLDWRYYVAAFVAFRLFDILKPWPCRRLERLPGGAGIMADDIAAGVYAGALVWVLGRLLSQFLGSPS
ncbi:MAG: phosphatidylglycerophosphatase A [Alphaproteobacteria bacterium]